MCQYPFKDLEILWILMQMQSFNLSNVSICSIEYILSCSLLLSGALLINHFFERLKYARVKNLSVHRIHTLKDYSKHGQTIYQFLWTMHKEFDKLECMQAQIYQSMKDTKILKYTLIIHAQAKNISVYQWRQSLDEPAHPCQSAQFFYWWRLWYIDKKITNIRLVQERCKWACDFKSVQELFFWTRPRKVRFCARLRQCNTLQGITISNMVIYWIEIINRVFS